MKGGDLYEAHHTLVSHHGPNPVCGKRGGTGGRDRLRWSAKLGRWAWRVHPEGRKRCPSGRHYRGQGSSPRGRNNPQEWDQAARRRRRYRSPHQSQSRLALLEACRRTGGYLRPRRREHQKRRAHRAARERCERIWLHVPGLQVKIKGEGGDSAFVIDVYAARNTTVVGNRLIGNAAVGIGAGRSVNT